MIIIHSTWRDIFFIAALISILGFLLKKILRHYILLFSSTYQTHCNYVPKQILYVGVNVIFELACKHQNIIYISTIRFARGGKKGNTARKYFWPYSREYELGSFSKTFHGGKYIACNSLCLVSLQELNECWFGTKL